MQWRYGNKCDKTCSVNCAEGVCDQQTGACHRGCKSNRDGEMCDSKSSFTTPLNTDVL
jgi:hypothetical protein